MELHSDSPEFWEPADRKCLTDKESLSSVPSERMSELTSSGVTALRFLDTRHAVRQSSHFEVEPVGLGPLDLEERKKPL